MKLTVPPLAATAGSGAVTVEAWDDGGAPPVGVAHSSFTSTVRLPPPVLEAGYSNVIEKSVMWVKSSCPCSVVRHMSLVH